MTYSHLWIKVTENGESWSGALMKAYSYSFAFITSVD